jgi:ankyrin repeat protein
MHAIRGSRWFGLLSACPFVLLLASGEPARAAAAPREAAKAELERRRSGFTPSDFVEVAAHWDVDLVRLYLDAGADPNAPHEYGATALGEAASRDRGETIDLLVSRGARPDARAQDETPLSMAALRDNLTAVKALIRARANVNLPKGTDDPGQTPLWLAATSRCWDTARLLLEAGADPNPYAGGGPPIVYAAQYGHAPTVRLLLEKGAKGDELAGALYVAILQGRAEAVRLLLEAGVPVPGDRDALVRDDSDVDADVKRLLANPPKPGAGAKTRTEPASPTVPSSPKAIATVLKPGEAEGALEVEGRDSSPSRQRFALKYAWAFRVGEEWRVVLADRSLDRRAVETWASGAEAPPDPELRAVAVAFDQRKQGVSSEIRLGGRTVTSNGNVLDVGTFDGKTVSGRVRTNSPGELDGKTFGFEAAFVAPLPEPWNDGVSPEKAARAEATEPARRFREYEKALRERDVATLAGIVPEAFGPDNDASAIRENLVMARVDQLRDTQLQVRDLDGESASFLVVGRDEDGWPRTKNIYLHRKESGWVMNF